MPQASPPESLLGQRVQLPGHFEGLVTVEAVRSLGQGWEVRVRLASGASWHYAPVKHRVKAKWHWHGSAPRAI